MDPGSYLAIVDMAAKVVTLAFKTKQLWDEIKDVPNEVSDLLRELHLTGRLFDALRLQLERLSRPDLTWDERIMFDCLDSAITAQFSLDDLVADLQRQLSASRKGSRYLVAAKVVMKKDVLQKLKERLNGSVRLLHLAYQLVSMQLIPELTAARVASTLTIVAQTSVSGSNTHQTIERHTDEASAYDGEHATKGMTEPGTCKTKFRHRPRKLSYHGQIALIFAKGTGACGFYLQMPRWWSSKVWEFVATPSPTGGGFHYRVYNVRPDDSEVFQCIERGDVSRVQQMLDNGEASCLDITQNGRTLAEKAFACKKLDMYEMLMNKYDTAAVLERRGRGHRRMACLLLSAAGYSWPRRQIVLSPEDRTRVKRLWQPYLSRHEDVMATEICVAVSLWGQLAKQMVCESLDLFSPNFRTADPFWREPALGQMMFGADSPATVWRFTGASGTISAQAYSDLPEVTKQTLLHSAAIAIGYRGLDQLPARGRFDRIWWSADNVGREWIEFARTVISLSSHELILSQSASSVWIPQSCLCSLDWKGTLLISLIGAVLCGVSPNLATCHWDAVIQNALCEWLKALQEAGVDLERYGDSERATLRRFRATFGSEAFFKKDWSFARSPKCARRYSEDIAIFDSFNLLHCVPLRIIGLVTGPEVRDWRLIWAPEYEWMASQFWDTIERQRVMPGTWVD